MDTEFLSSLPDLHVPVLLKEAIDALQPRPGGRYLDGTLGLAGHAFALLQRASLRGDRRAVETAAEADARACMSQRSVCPDAEAELCGLDRDVEALELARARLAPFGNRVHLFHRRYSEFEEVLDGLGWETVDGALIDIGVSSLQIDRAERGFSFLADGPLDMRMDRDSGEAPVSRMVNRAGFEQLKDIIARYGEDPQAGRITRCIVEERARKPIETTRELAALVERAYPPAWRARSRNHPATRTFQALRMAVNDELGELERFLAAILSRLAVGGRVAVISFHSLEDRIVKHLFRSWACGCICPPHVPVCVCGHTPEARVITPKPVLPSHEETAQNPRAASAKLRVAEKIAPGEAAQDDRRQRYEAKRAARGRAGSPESSPTLLRTHARRREGRVR